jgi:hypothetical protein
MTAFPNDANGDVLRRMQAGGDDLTKPRDIDFEFVFTTEQRAKDFADQVRSGQNLKPETSRYEKRNMWQTTVTKHMLPTHQDITAVEQMLTRLPQLHDGKADGWGCFMVKESK